MKIKENWAHIQGKILSVKEETGENPFYHALLKVEHLKDYQEFPNLIRPNNKDEIVLKIKKEDFERLDLEKGIELRAVIRAFRGNICFPKPGSMRKVKKSDEK